jgi:NTE family protein
VSAVIDVLVDANTQSSYTAFAATMKAWRDAMVQWRCGLPRAEVDRLRGHGGPWNCRDLKITIGRVNFGELDAARAQRLNKVPTTFTLPPATVEELRAAGGDALRATPAFQEFLKEM